MVRLAQRLCPTADPCFGGDGAHPWRHGGHDETNNLVMTPVQADPFVVLSAAETTSGCAARYDGRAVDVEPLAFRGLYHCDNADGTRAQTGTFTLARA